MRIGIGVKGPAFRRGRPAASLTGVLDAYTAGMWAAYGITRLIGAYGLGPAINVRRSSDNATTDINFLANGTLDTATLATFIGANSGYVTTWYDQFSVNHLLQATAANQPRIVNAGVYDGKIVFNPTGTLTVMRTATSSASVAVKSVFRKVNQRAVPGTGAGVEYECGADTAYPNAALAGSFEYTNTKTPTNNGIYIFNAAGNGYVIPTYDSLSESNVTNGQIISTSSPYVKFYQAGALQTPSSTPTAGTAPSGNLKAGKFGIGGAAGSNAAQIDMWACAFYDADKTTDANAINTAIA